MSRDAVSERPGSGRDAGPAGDPVAALARLPDSEREILVLRLLCGHTLDHTAHLAGYSRRAVLGLQLAACLAIAEHAGGTAAPPGASAEALERQPDRSEIAPTAPDPALSAALSAARGLRLAAAHVVAPDPELVASLRHELMVAETPSRPDGPFIPAEPSLAHPAEPSLAHPKGTLTGPGAGPHPPGPHPPGPHRPVHTRAGRTHPGRCPGPRPGG